MYGSRSCPYIFQGMLLHSLSVARTTELLVNAFSLCSGWLDTPVTVSACLNMLQLLVRLMKTPSV
jgi:hypothetical protein